MKILIDLQGAQTESRFRGIGRYSLSLAKAMAREPRDHRISLLLNGSFEDSIEPIRAAFSSLIPQEQIHVWFPIPGTARASHLPRWRYQASAAIRAAAVHRIAPDVLHISSVMEGFIDEAVTDLRTIGRHIRIAATCYDLIPLLNKDVYLPPSQAITPYYYDRLEELRHADRILAISEAGRNEIIEHLPADPDDVSNIAAACDACFAPMDRRDAEADADLKSLGIDRPFILYTGGADDRKNLHRLVEAFAMLPEALRGRFQLALVGRMPDGRQVDLQHTASRFGLPAGSLVLPGWISDRRLRACYVLCSGFVFPSLHEGFGLPALEAMTSGAPTIASRASSLVEIVRRDEAMFDATDTRSISDAITRLLTDPDWKERLRREGLEEARRYSWEASASLALDALEATRDVPAKRSGRPSDIGDCGRAVAARISRLPDIEPDDAALAGVADRIVASLPAPGRRLLLDVSTIVHLDVATGIQRVVRALVADFMQRPPEGIEVALVQGGGRAPGYRHARRYEAVVTGSNDFATHHADEEMPLAIRPGDVFLGIDLAHAVVSANRPLYEHWRRLGAQVHFVVYDLLPVLMPENFRDISDSLHSRWLHDIAHGDGLLCISRSVADEALAWLDEHGPERQRPLSIGWFHLGADLHASRPSTGLPPDSQSTLEKISEEPAFLMVGTMEPRKGHRQVLEAFERLWSAGVQANLVIVGRMGWGTEELCARLKTHPEAGRRLHWLREISDEFLDCIYRACSALIAASLGEGFGLPIVEARLHGMATIARDIPVFREIADERTAFFRGTDAASLAEAIQGWLMRNRVERVQPAEGTWLTWHESRMQLERVLLGGQWYQHWSGRPADNVNHVNHS